MNSDEQVALVSSEPHQPLPGKLWIYFLLFQNQAQAAATSIGALLWIKQSVERGWNLQTVFPSVTSILFGSKGDRLCVCLSVRSASQSTDMPSVSPRLFTAHSKLAEVYVTNATINLAIFIVCPNSLLFLTRGTVLYWSLFPNMFEKFPPGLKHSFISFEIL